MSKRALARETFLNKLDLKLVSRVVIHNGTGKHTDCAGFSETFNYAGIAGHLELPMTCNCR
jgi:hypothetical protein